MKLFEDENILLKILAVEFGEIEKIWKMVWVRVNSDKDEIDNHCAESSGMRNAVYPQITVSFERSTFMNYSMYTAFTLNLTFDY